MSYNIDRKLHFAAGLGDEDTVRQCLKAGGATVDWRGGACDHTALHLAAISDHDEVARLLVEAGWSLEARNYEGSTPVLMAAWNDAGETMEYLLDSGAHIDTQNDNKRTPLHVASQKGHTMVVEHLLMCGANQKIEDKWGYTALDLAVIHDETREVLIDFMKKDKGGDNPAQRKRKREEDSDDENDMGRQPWQPWQQGGGSREHEGGDHVSGAQGGMQI